MIFIITTTFNHKNEYKKMILIDNIGVNFIDLQIYQ